MKIEFYKHNLGKDEKRMVLECLDGIFLTTGSYVDRFERDFASYLGAKHCVGLNSCTAALHLALLALGVGPGDEVITTPLTFIATATAILHTGATPVFIDVEQDTGLMDPERISGAVTSRTKAVIPVHLYGQMCDMKRIKAAARKHNLKIVEDAAHCIEGQRDGIRPGQLGDAACFSFYATKNMTCGEGGALVTNHRLVAEKVRMLRTHGMTKEAAKRYSGPYKHWDMVDCGWKYNMSNIEASLLLPQIRKIDLNWAKRERLYRQYQKALRGIPGVLCPKIAQGSKSAFHLLTVWVDPRRRDALLKHFGDQGIGVAVHYRPVHLLKYFRETFHFKKGDFPVSENIGSRTISLPFWPGLTAGQVKHITAQLKAGL